jgi:hypothetical protein
VVLKVNSLELIIGINSLGDGDVGNHGINSRNGNLCSDVDEVGDGLEVRVGLSDGGIVDAHGVDVDIGELD